MNRKENINQIIEKRQPLAQEITRVENNLELILNYLNLIEEKRNQLIKQLSDESILHQAGFLDFYEIKSAIATERKHLSKLIARFSRKTINIGVVGRPRQGKSSLLQSLTGLTTKEIPDSRGQTCTGVGSKICHDPEQKEAIAEVLFHSKTSFLEEVIHPYYEDKDLNLGRKPLSLEEFATFHLPEPPKNIEKQADLNVKCDFLKRYKDNLREYQDLLTGRSATINRDEIRDYVAQRSLDGKQLYNFFAIKEVTIRCQFPNSEVGEIALIDMPGLGENKIGEEEKLIKILGEKIDIILFVKMPSATGDDWLQPDIQLYDITQKALLELPLKEWSFLVLNRKISGEEDNKQNCKDLKKSVNEKSLKVQDTFIASCINEEETQQVLDQILDYLAANITHLDQKYAHSTQQNIEKIQSKIEQELEKLQTIFPEGILDEDLRFQTLFDDFWSILTNQLWELLEKLRYKRETENDNFTKKVKEILKKCQDSKEMPSEDMIKKYRIQEKSPHTAYDKYLHELRCSLSDHFLELDQALEYSLKQLKAEVANVLIAAIPDEGLGKLTDKRDEEFISAIAAKIPDQQKFSKRSIIKLGLEVFAEFKLSYRGLIQHRIRKHLNILNPNDPERLQLPRESSAEDILNNLKTAYQQAVFNCGDELNELLCEPSEVEFAIVDEFCDRILYAKGAKKEWENFLRKYRHQIWSEFIKLEKDKKLQAEWFHQIQKLKEANQVNQLKLINT